MANKIDPAKQSHHFPLSVEFGPVLNGTRHLAGGGNSFMFLWRQKKNNHLENWVHFYFSTSPNKSDGVRKKSAACNKTANIIVVGSDHARKGIYLSTTVRCAAEGEACMHWRPDYMEHRKGRTLSKAGTLLEPEFREGNVIGATLSPALPCIRRSSWAKFVVG